MTAPRYFYLSYPRVRPLPPLPGLDPPDPPDEWIRALHRDLGTAIRALAGRPAAGPAGPRPGFLDGAAAPGADAPARSDALASAEVFVPLLCPEYFRGSWPGREWASFEQRLLNAGITSPRPRLAPVLWSPVPAGEQAPGLAEALSLAPADVRGRYSEIGLRTMLRLSRYRLEYLRVVERVAARIAELAERAPVGPSPAPDPGDCDSAFTGRPTGRVFALAIAAPAGPAGEDWTPAGWNPPLPAAEYARAAAERQGFAVLIADLDKSAEVLQDSPGAVLIDPGYRPGTPACDALLAVVSKLPSWAPPILITGQNDPAQTEAMRTGVANSYNAYQSHPDTVRRGIRGISSLRELVTLLPFAVSQAEREYLRHGPIRRSGTKRAFRLRLGGGAPPT